MEAEEQRRQMSQHEENEASLSLPCGRQKLDSRSKDLVKGATFNFGFQL